jgi:hypothetical protein
MLQVQAWRKEIVVNSLTKISVRISFRICVLSVISRAADTAIMMHIVMLMHSSHSIITQLNIGRNFWIAGIKMHM